MSEWKVYPYWAYSWGETNINFDYSGDKGFEGERLLL